MQQNNNNDYIEIKKMTQHNLNKFKHSIKEEEKNEPFLCYNHYLFRAVNYNLKLLKYFLSIKKYEDLYRDLEILFSEDKTMNKKELNEHIIHTINCIAVNEVVIRAFDGDKKYIYNTHKMASIDLDDEYTFLQENNLLPYQ
jgi:hypothetical protein